MLRLLGLFVSSRFLLLPAFCLLYYFQLSLGQAWPRLRSACLFLLIATLAAAIAANRMWIVDFRKRLESGFKYLNSATFPPVEGKEALEQMRWCNVQILGLIIMILGILSQYQYLEKIPQQHRVPALALVLLILVALFDGILDLHAEWIITTLAAIKMSEPNKLSLPKAIWRVNQYSKDREKLYNCAVHAKPTTMGFASFPGGTQNIISFAILIVGGLAVTIIAFLWLQFRTIR
jgi:hypothetical protein